MFSRLFVSKFVFGCLALCYVVLSCLVCLSCIVLSSLHWSCVIRYTSYIHRAAQEHMKKARKPGPPPLHVSLYHIAEEKRKLQQRTKAKLDSLLPKTSHSLAGDVSPCDIKHGDMRVTTSHSVLITLCFCLWLLIIHLLYMQWLFSKVSARDQG